DSNAKVFDSVYGRDALLFGIDVNQVKDTHKFKLGLDIMGPDKYSRDLDGQSTKYSVGSLIDLNGSILWQWRDYEYGGHASLLSLSSLKVEKGGTQAISKERDQFLSAGPEFRYIVNQDVTAKLLGDYLFNSSNSDEDTQIRDLFGNGLGQWKFTLGVEIFL
ncbi:MAG: hypothetical protein K2Q18_13150, partial [Bdellovibrionales bacterium]|nr:hypothetical protein [Bdellovibrionales bacterium]